MFDIVYDENFDFPKSKNSNVSSVEAGVLAESEISGPEVSTESQEISVTDNQTQHETSNVQDSIE